MINKNIKPIHAMKTTAQNPARSNPRVYVLQPLAASGTLSAPAVAPAAKTLPPRQPLPRPVIDPARPMLKLGLDVHLEFIMAVAQKEHAMPHTPRKFTNDQLVEQVKRWTAEGLQVFCVQESCGFGFVLHRRLVEVRSCSWWGASPPVG